MSMQATKNEEESDVGGAAAGNRRDIGSNASYPTNGQLSTTEKRIVNPQQEQRMVANPCFLAV